MTETNNNGVLILDADQDGLVSWADKVLALGYGQIFVAKSGERALQLLKEKPIGLILAELDMPGMDGVEFVHMLSRVGYRHGLIFISDQPEDVVRSVMHIADFYQLGYVRHLDKRQPDLEQLKNFVGNSLAYTEPLHFPLHHEAPEDEIATGLREEQFYFLCQPKVRLEDRHWVGVELLSRWLHPRKGELTPDLFIDRIETVPSLAHMYNNVLVEQGLRIAKELSEQHGPLEVGVNIPASAFVDKSLFEHLILSLHKLDLDTDCLLIELTERSENCQSVKAMETLARLRLRGFRLALDDFGAGFSNMEAIERLPVNEIKIERQFIKRMEYEKSARAFVKMSIGLAHEMGIIATAEGVETIDQWAILRDLGCDCAQGYWVGKPISGSRLPQWHADWQAGQIAETA